MIGSCCLYIVSRAWLWVSLQDVHSRPHNDDQAYNSLANQKLRSLVPDGRYVFVILYYYTASTWAAFILCTWIGCSHVCVCVLRYNLLVVVHVSRWPQLIVGPIQTLLSITNLHTYVGGAFASIMCLCPDVISYVVLCGVTAELFVQWDLMFYHKL